MTNRRAGFLLGLAVAAITAGAFLPVLRNGFVALDDPTYVTRNPRIQGGFSVSTLVWAITTRHADNWHPLTWLSHALDWTLFGAAAWGHHLTSLILHVASAVLLFAALRRMTGAPIESALVAALFGAHPLRVESVAWVAERKDVLSGLFWMLAMLVYARRAGANGPRSLTPVAALLALGLAAKPMLVGLPLALLLLDVWPLGRLASKPLSGLLLEKLPLVLLAAASAALTLWAQGGGGAIASFERYAWDIRVENAIVAYVLYLRDAAWPTGLALYYPHPGDSLPGWQVAGSAALLAVVTIFAWRLRKRAPYLIVGWSWYVLTLLPVIGLVQVGWQARADRYTYLPMIGIAIAVVWGARDLGRRPRAGLIPLVLAVPLLAVLSWRQAGAWRDSRTLFERSLAAAPANATILWALGNVADDEGRPAEAIARYREALQVQPRFPEVHHNLAFVLAEQGASREAEAHLRESLALAPDYALSLRDLGRLLVRTGRAGEAIGPFEKRVRLEPESAEARSDLGAALGRIGDLTGALEQLRRAVALDPESGEAHSNLAAALLETGRRGEALEHLELAFRHGHRPPDELVRRLKEEPR